jgi:hypothetical protein
MSKKKEQKPERKITHQLTLDEYDALTEECLKRGAEFERRDIISHLADVRSQIRGVAALTSKIPLRQSLKDLEDGIDASIEAIKALPELYDRAGCENCGSI